jgi:hypothetical protein
MRPNDSFNGTASRWILGAMLLAGSVRPMKAGATASTQIWNPSTDIQKTGTVHFGIDNYFSIADNKKNPYAILPDCGVTVGVLKYLEVGVDLIEPTADPLYFNLKLGLPENGSLPALALGAFNFGTKKDVTDYNMVYGLAAKTLPTVGRISLGYYTGLNENLFLDETGDKAASGVIATWDKALTDKIWASVDYASGKSWYGSLSLGGSVAFSSNVSVLFGYVLFNNDQVVPNNTFTTQLDINL